MSKICKKCGYARKEIESKPDYECPNCGAIYSKVESQIQERGAVNKINKKPPEVRKIKMEKKAEPVKENKSEQIQPIIKEKILSQDVVIKDIQMPFWSMVVFMVKWAVATIPALIILIFLVMFAMQIISG